MRKYLTALFILFNIFGAVYGKNLDLINTEDFFNKYETGPSTSVSLTEDFENFISTGNWLDFQDSLWNKIREDKEAGDFFVPRCGHLAEVEESTPTLQLDDLPEAQIELPYQTRMSISGRKSISVKYGNVFYMADEDHRSITGTPGGVTNGFEMEQELRVRIKGKVGEKITVNVDYDDTKPEYDESARKISVLYKGDPEEIVQKAAFGDINLSIPSTKFVGYSKNVFGASVKGRYKKLNFMAIGSQTKGKTDVKEFRGQTTFTKKDINDTSYTRRKYFDIDIGTDTSHLPIDQGSLRVYVDDRDITNIDVNNESTMTVTYAGSTQTYTGNFYRLVAGRDYYMDYDEGILTFNRPVNEEYIVAAAYTYDDGQSDIGYTGNPVVIMDKSAAEEGRLSSEAAEPDYELKNRYNLGATKLLRDDFVIKFLDLNRNSVSIPEGSYTVDYDLGLLEFTDKTPFYNESNGSGYADIYNNSSPQHHYIIYVEYEQIVKSYFLKPNIIRGSERVIMNGRVLERNSDYIIDYPSGFLTFLNEEEIDETTHIEVSYEYMPFGGLFKETLIGARAEYNFSKNFFLGGTALYNWASSPLEIPQLQSTPESTLVLDANFNLNIPKSDYMPFPTKLEGEFAWSEYNPNRLGRAMIDNMEGIRQAYGVSTSADSWRIAATPSDTPADPDWITLDEDDVYLYKINSEVPDSEDEKVKVLYLSYNLPTTWDGPGDPETSVVYPLSRTGVDLSDKDEIALWVYSDGKGSELQIDFGSISEDADGTGQLKTEDANLNSTLDVGEDTGWDYVYKGSTRTLGANNGEIDSNDLDNDGYLDTFQKYSRFDSSVNADLKLNWTGWRRIVMERGGSDSDWDAVKHVRITVKGANITGTIGIGALEAVGNKWEIGLGTATLKIRAVNNYDDADYSDDLVDMEIYEEIYEGVGGSGLEKEQALELEYTDLTAGATAYARYKYPQAVDFSKHEKIAFLMYDMGENEDVDYFISIGAGDNYYIRKIPAGSIINNEWTRKSFDLPKANDDGDFTKVGSPSMVNISEVRVGIINSSSMDANGKVWFNEIYLDKADKRQGKAMRGSFETTVPGVMKVGGSYETMDKDFQTITTQPKNQDFTSYSGKVDLTALSFLPVSANYARREVVTPPERIAPNQLNPYLREDDAGKVTNKSGGLSANLRVRKLPNIGGSYSESESESDFTGKRETTKNYKGNASYTVPLNIFLLPRNISGSFRKTDNFVDWKQYQRDDNPLGGYEDRLEETLDYSGNLNWNFFNVLTLSPSYDKNEKYKTWDYYAGDFAGREKRFKWSQSQKTALSANLKILSWFRPSGSYTINITENYNFISQNGYSLPKETKDVSRNFNFSGGVSFPVSKMLPWFEPARTLSVSLNMGIEKGETWKNIEEDYGVFDKLDQTVSLHPSTSTAELETLTARYSDKLVVNWCPFKFAGLNEGLFKLLGDMSSKFMYNFIESESVNKGTELRNTTRIWPDADINYGKLDRLPFAKNLFTEIRLRTNYSRKEAMTFSNGDGVDRDTLTKFGANCRFLVLKNYDALFEYSNQDQEIYDLELDRWHTRSNSRTYTGQVKFALKKYTNLIVRYSQTKNIKNAYNSEDPLTDTRVYRPGISFDSIIDMPSTWKIPLLGREVKMVNRLKLSSSFNAEFSRSELNVDKTNTDKYNLNFSAEMDFSSNMRFTFGMGGQYQHYLREYQAEDKNNDYISFYLKSDLVIRF